jgi:hypothetical protein
MRQRNGHYNRSGLVVHVRWHPYKPIPAKFPPFELESKGKNAEEPRNRAEWAKAIAGVLFKRSEARSKEVKLANGEALPTGAEKILHDTLTVPDLASVEASFERTRLLIQQGPGVAGMAVDASTSIQAKKHPREDDGASACSGASSSHGPVRFRSVPANPPQSSSIFPILSTGIETQNRLGERV